MLEFFLGKTGLFVAVGAAVVSLLSALFFAARKAGRDEQKAKQADAYQKHLDDIAAAGNARPRGGVSDDPRNRDNR